MMHKSGIFAVVTALLILALLSPAAYADQNEALIEAIRKNDSRQVQELLKKGADVNAKDEHGSLPWCWLPSPIAGVAWNW